MICRRNANVKSLNANGIPLRTSWDKSGGGAALSLRSDTPGGRLFLKCVTRLFETETRRTASKQQNHPPSSSLDYGLNLSISISPGKENNCDAPSNGERSGQSSNMKGLLQDKPLLFRARVGRGACAPSALEWDAMEGDSPVRACAMRLLSCPTSSVPCEWSVKCQVIPW